MDGVIGFFLCQPPGGYLNPIHRDFMPFSSNVPSSLPSTSKVGMETE